MIRQNREAKSYVLEFLRFLHALSCDSRIVVNDACVINGDRYKALNLFFAFLYELSSISPDFESDFQVFTEDSMEIEELFENMIHNSYLMDIKSKMVEKVLCEFTFGGKTCGQVIAKGKEFNFYAYI